MDERTIAGSSFGASENDEQRHCRDYHRKKRNERNKTDHGPNILRSPQWAIFPDKQ
jgi:hypothetical protein